MSRDAHVCMWHHDEDGERDGPGVCPRSDCDQVMDKVPAWAVRNRLEREVAHAIERAKPSTSVFWPLLRGQRGDS